MGRKGPVLVHGGSDGTWFAYVVLFPETGNGVLAIDNASLPASVRAKFEHHHATVLGLHFVHRAGMFRIERTFRHNLHATLGVAVPEPVFKASPLR